MYKTYFGWMILIIIILTPMSKWLESTMTTHMLILYPLLAASGALISWPYRKKGFLILQFVNKGGISGILITTFTLAFWMVPRWVDLSLTHYWIGIFKYLSLTFLVGYTLTMSWMYLHTILKALLKIEFLTMLLRLGWIYMISPNRLCNNYLLYDQIILGKGFFLLAIALALYWMVPLFVESDKSLRYNKTKAAPIPQ